MIEILIYILIPNLIIGFFTQRAGTSLGSDHAIHVNIIDRIKRNKHRFLNDHIISINEQNVYYPQLFHWFLSFLPDYIYKQKSIYINLIVKALEVLSFNIFLSFLYFRLDFPIILFLYANTIINVFPFSYAIWNAKNMGVSARGIGLVVGQVYTYFLLVYAMTDNKYLLIFLFVSVFVIMLTSQMAMQYVLLSLLFFLFFFKMPEIILMPFLAYALFYLIMPKVALSYIKGQYNHKRNYALYNAETFLLKSRPSIYRDFVYDFWIKLKGKFLPALVYIFFNPLVEIIYGLPFLWIVLYLGVKDGYNNEQAILFYAVLTGFGTFFVTSLKWTRFLGEPQRYLEFVIPIITVLYVLNFTLAWHIVLVIACVLFIVITSYVLKKQSDTSPKNVNRAIFLEFVKKEMEYKGKICISNENEVLKYLASMGMEIVRSDTSSYFKNRTEYFKLYYNDSLYIHSPLAINIYNNKFKADWLVLNTEFYSKEFLSKEFDTSKMNFVKKVHNYELYELKK